jgi:hypothetical protein
MKYKILYRRGPKEGFMNQISDDAITMLNHIASLKSITSTELRTSKLVSQNSFLSTRQELLVNRLIKRKQDLHPRSKRGRRADIWIATRKGLELLGKDIPADYIEESCYDISIKRQISLLEKSSINIDLGSGTCILLPELSVEPQELIDNSSIGINQLMLIEKDFSVYKQIEQRWPNTKIWNGGLIDAIKSLAPSSISYIHADLMSIFGQETIDILTSTKNKLTETGSWIRLTNTAMSFRDNWSCKQLHWNSVSENLLDLHDMGYLDYDQLRHYLLYVNNDLLHSAWMSWSYLVQTHIDSNMAVTPKGIVHYRGNSTSTPMETCWFSITPNNNPENWIKYSLSEMTRLLNNANYNFYDNQSIQ